MNFLTVLLKILQIIGFALAGIIALILILMLLVLFYPVRYSGRIRFKDNKPDIKIKVSYLFNLVRGKYILNENEKVLDYVIICRRLFGKDKKKKGKNSKKRNKKKRSTASVKPSAGKHKNDTPLKSTKSAKKYFESDKKKYTSTDSGDESKKSILQKLKNMYNKVKGIFLNIRKKFEYIRKEYNDKDNREAFSFAIGMIKKFLKHSLPRKYVINIKLGAGNAATTGEIVGLAYTLSSMFCLNVNITPDFENKIFECDIPFRGRLCVLIILIWIIKVFRHKQLRALIDKISSYI